MNKPKPGYYVCVNDQAVVYFLGIGDYMDLKGLEEVAMVRTASKGVSRAIPIILFEAQFEPLDIRYCDACNQKTTGYLMTHDELTYRNCSACGDFREV